MRRQMRSRLGALVGAFLLLGAITGQGKADLIGHGAPVRDIVISPDGTQALTAGFDDILILWDLAQRKALLRFAGHAAAANAGVFLGSKIASVGDDGTLRIWDRKTGKLLNTIPAHEKKVVAIAASPDQTLIATGSWDRTVKVWDVESGDLVKTFTRHRNSVNAVVFSSDGRRLFSGAYDGSIWQWSVSGDEEPRRFTDKGFPINDMALSTDGARLVSSSADATVRIWDTASGQMTRELKGHEGAVLAVAISPDGQTIASGSTDGYLLLWDGGEGPRQKLPVQYYRAVWSLSFTPDSKQIYAAGVDSVARGWFVEDGAPVTGETTPFKPIDRVDASLATSEDLVERGSFHYRKCAICHTLKEDGSPRAGPSLEGIFGRKVGTYPGYHYSDALTSSDIIWTPETLSKLFEIGPDNLLPGTKMPLQLLPKAEDRAALVEFLKAKTQ